MHTSQERLTEPRAPTAGRRFPLYLGSIAAKLYTISIVALIVLTVSGGLLLLTFIRLEHLSRTIARLSEEARRTEELFRNTVILSQKLDDIISKGDTDLIPTVLAENETLVSDFSAYGSADEQLDLAADATFAAESEALMLQIRTDIHETLLLYRNGDTTAAKAIKQKVDRNIHHLSTTVAGNASQRQYSLTAQVSQIADLQRRQYWTLLAVLSAGAVTLFGVSFGFARSIISSLRKLTASAEQIAAGNYAHRVQMTSRDEIGQLAQAFNQMSNSLQDRQEQIAQQQLALAQRAAELEQMLAELHQTSGERDQLHFAIRELSSPAIPVADDTLVMPLIGVIDSERAANLTQSLLAAIERHRARFILLDVTGVPIIDTSVAQALLNVTSAAQLLGAQTILVGLRPELAQTIVGLGLHLTDLVTQADLRSGLRYATQLRSRRGGA